MKANIIVKYKDEKTGLFKALPDFYEEKNGKIFTKLAFSDIVYRMLSDDVGSDFITTVSKFGNLGDRRGIPIDASDVYLKLVKQSRGQFHNFFYLKELENITNQGYLNIKDDYENKYSELAFSFINFIDNLSRIADEKNICLNCIRICFYFTEID